jgi:hypothetical protein
VILISLAAVHLRDKQVNLILNNSKFYYRWMFMRREILAFILVLLPFNAAAEESLLKFYSWDPATKTPRILEGEEIDISGEQGTYYFINPPLRVDANRDGDTLDEEDYVLYNALYIINSSYAEFVLSFYDPSEAETINVRGKEYLLIYSNPYQQQFRYAERYHYLTLPRKGSILSREATPFPQDANLKVEYVNPTVSLGNVIGTLAFFVGNNYHSSVSIFEGRFPKDITSELKDPFKKYKIYVVEADSTHAKLVIVKRGEENAVWVKNGDTDVLGYSRVAAFTLKYGGRGEGGPSLGNDAKYFIHFRGEAFKLTQGCVDIEGTLYELCYDGVRKLSIRLREEFAVPPEPKPEETQAPITTSPLETTPAPTQPPATEKPEEEKKGVCGPTLLALLALIPLLRRPSFASCTPPA